MLHKKKLAIFPDELDDISMSALEQSAENLEQSIETNENRQEEQEEYTQGYDKSMPSKENMAQVGALYPKSKFSMWYVEMLSIEANKADYKRQIAAAMIDASLLPVLYGTTRTTWLSIKHAIGPERQEKIKKQIANTKTNIFNLTERFKKTGKIDKKDHLKAIEDIEIIWDEFYEILAATQLLIRFFRPDATENTLKKFGKRPERAIIGNEEGV